MERYYGKIGPRKQCLLLNIHRLRKGLQYDVALCLPEGLAAIEHIPITSGYNLFSTNRTVLNLHARESELFYNSVKKSAEEIGMRVNDKKTQLTIKS